MSAEPLFPGDDPISDEEELEQLLNGGDSDDGHRSDGQGVGDHPADGAAGRTGAGEGAGATEGGAGEGPGVEPLVGEVEGYRVFWVRGDQLHSLAVGGAWRPGSNAASCSFAGVANAPRAGKKKRATTTWVNDGDKLKEITVEDGDVDEDEIHGLIPSANCHCGFWVYKSAERARAQFASDLKRPRGPYGDFDGADELVMASVAGWGRAVEGADGWRFEKARIIGLITDEPHRFRGVLDRYKIPALQTVGLGPWLDFEAKPLADTLAGVEAYIRKYVVLTEEQRTAVVLWAAHTWAIDACEVSPYLSVTSAVMRSGKSQLVGTLRYVVAEPWVAIQPSEAVLFRRIDEVRPTLFLDEVDTLFHSKDDRHEPLRALLNAGNRRGTTVPRVVKSAKGDMGIVDFEVFCAKLLAGIGHPPVTVADRAIAIRMQKKLPQDMQSRFREAFVRADALEPRQQMALWASSGAIERLRDAWPDLPDELNDRLQDSWEPLLAIADEAGADWPARARAAALELAKVAEDAVPRGVELLADIRDIRDASDGLERVTTEDLLKALVEKDPWGGWWGDQVEAGRLKSPAARLSRMLGEFGIKPKQLWMAGGKTRGYEFGDFAEAWERNLSSLSPEDGRDSRNGRPQVTDGASDQEATDPTVPTVSPKKGEMSFPETRNNGHGAGGPLNGLPIEELEELLGTNTSWMVVNREVNARGYRRQEGRPWTSVALNEAYKQAKGRR
jgi:hypothetical protein